MIGDDTTAVGRAKTVLVYGEGELATALVSTVIARLCSDSHGERLRFTGPVTFGSGLVSHCAQSIVPAVDAIIGHVAVPRGTRHGTCFDVSVVNVGATSADDLGLEVSGYSADAPIALAILSSVLNIPVPQDLVATGHLASPDGDIRPVGSIPEKLAAAARDPGMRMFVCPSLEADASMQLLSPRRKGPDRARDSRFQGHHTCGASCRYV